MRSLPEGSLAAVRKAPRRRRLVRAGGAVLAVVLLAFLLTPMGRYLARAAWEEGWILAHRESIAELLEGGAGDTGLAPDSLRAFNGDAPSSRADSARGTGADAARGRPLSRAERDKLRLVLEARRFAEARLGLTAGASFTQYSRLRRDTLVLVLSAARRDTLAPYTWWFPVVGRFPYKGFFDFNEARRTAERMQRAGYDTYLRPAAAFSTLGWFNDPLLSTTLRLDSLDLVETVIHELTHGTVFVRNEVAFNESFASFVGAHGAAAFFRGRGDERAARAVESAWRDEKLLGAFWGATLAAVDSAYRAHPGDSAQRVAARDRVFARMRDVLVRDLAPRLSTVPVERLQRLPLDNASLLARQVYAADPWLLDAIHERTGRSLPSTMALVTRLVAAPRAGGGGGLAGPGGTATREPAAAPDRATTDAAPFVRLRRWLETAAATGAGVGGRDSLAATPSPPR